MGKSIDVILQILEITREVKQKDHWQAQFNKVSNQNNDLSKYIEQLETGVKTAKENNLRLEAELDTLKSIHTEAASQDPLVSELTKKLLESNKNNDELRRVNTSLRESAKARPTLEDMDRFFKTYMHLDDWREWRFMHPETQNKLITAVWGAP